MKFSSYLNTDYIFPNLEASSKEEIIRKIVSKVAEDDRAVGEQKDEIIKNILRSSHGREYPVYRICRGRAGLCGLVFKSRY